VASEKKKKKKKRSENIVMLNFQIKHHFNMLRISQVSLMPNLVPFD
jgi:hypothetical protein